MPSREKTVTVSLRISEAAFKALQDDAKKQNFSLNTLANQLFISYSDYDRFLKRFRMIKVSFPTFRKILDAAKEEAILEAGKTAGASVPESFILSKMGELSVANALEYLRLSGTYANFYDYSEVSHSGRTTITLTHTLGPNWSLFLAHYVEEIFKAAGKQIKITRLSDSLTFEI
jgi:hypothetical protein